MGLTRKNLRMSEQDVMTQSFLYSWIVPILFLGSIYMLNRKPEKEHFHSMNYHKSHDIELKNKGLIRILEIGAGTGPNFEFYPANSKLTVVEPNPFFESIFYESHTKYPAIQLEKFVLRMAEDMSDVPDNSIDVVVSTLVLCSVRNLELTLKEVQRVLAPGGKFYYWEHVHDVPGTWLHTIQSFLAPV